MGYQGYAVPPVKPLPPASAAMPKPPAVPPPASPVAILRANTVYLGERLLISAINVVLILLCVLSGIGSVFLFFVEPSVAIGGVVSSVTLALLSVAASRLGLIVIDIADRVVQRP